jgi:hypothetical protein
MIQQQLQQKMFYNIDSNGLYYKSFTIIIYDHNDSAIVIYDRNDRDQGPYSQHFVFFWTYEWAQ